MRADQQRADAALRPDRRAPAQPLGAGECWGRAGGCWAVTVLVPGGRAQARPRVQVLQLTRPKPAADPQATRDDDPVLRHKGSLIRRTKHLSLKLHKSDTSKVVQSQQQQQAEQEQMSDCRVG